MSKRILTLSILLFSVIQANAQLGLMKLVGPGSEEYNPGVGLSFKAGFPVSNAADVTLDLGGNLFFLNDGSGNGTVMFPVKAGYRLTLNGSGEGFYVEPQAGYNVYGLTTLENEDGETIDLKYHGVVFAAGAGYLFKLGNVGFDINLHYETVIAHGGSNNFISLGITKSFRFGKRDPDY